MNEQARAPGYWAVIPASVRYDNGLRPNAKLLYGEISALAMAEGYCWANNDYFAQLFGVTKKTVGELIGQLSKRGHVRLEVVRDPGTNEVVQRKIWIANLPDIAAPPPPKNRVRSPEKSGDPPPKNREENNTSINIYTPLPPKGGDADAQTDAGFDRFWAAYPRKVDKARARRAWKRLKVGPALLPEIMAGLDRAKRSAQWHREGGRFIPHPTTWINNRRWEAAEDPPGTDPPGRVIEDEEVDWR